MTDFRILHTSDWHLGHTLHDVSRDYEHRKFLDWLLDILGQKEVDALLIAGDIFDSANPRASAQKLWYGFLAQAVKRFSKLDIVVIGGNHDSAARLDAPDPILSEFGVRVIGGVSPSGTKRKNEEYLIPLTDREGNVKACACAVPFLRPPDLPKPEELKSGSEDLLIEGTREFYRSILDAARKTYGNHNALIAMGHLYMTGTKLSELSERKILGGNQHALPCDIFPDYVSYAALGHLHLGQRVGHDHIRYSGSPIPLSLSERNYNHHVVLADFEGSACRSMDKLQVPRSVGMIRVPKKGFLPVVELKELLIDLELAEQEPDTPAPFLDVAVTLEKPEPSLRSDIAEAVNDKHVYLSKISVEYTGTGREITDSFNGSGLSELKADDVFIKRWEKDFSEPPGKNVLDAFSELQEKAWGDV